MQSFISSLSLTLSSFLLLLVLVLLLFPPSSFLLMPHPFSLFLPCFVSSHHYERWPQSREAAATRTCTTAIDNHHWKSRHSYRRRPCLVSTSHMVRFPCSAIGFLGFMYQIYVWIFFSLSSLIWIYFM